MELKVIPYRDVEAALEEARGNWEATDKFNTYLHSHQEISSVIPETHELKHVKPDREPGLFRHWITLIMFSQGVKHGGWHVFELSRFLAREITDACCVWCARNALNHDTVEDLIEIFPGKTRDGVPKEEVFKEGRKWFLRFDACSAKDSAARSSVVQSAADIINRACTSLRAAQALEDILNNESDPFQKANIFLVPFNPAMDPSREFRVFCPPLVGRISAISQYNWHKPSTTMSLEDVAKRAEKIYEASRGIYTQITRHSNNLRDVSLVEKMRTEGFTFDVLETPAGEIQLVEINPFGAMSGCGSCLFHWLQDAKVLYGLEERVEVRVAL